MEFFLYLTPIGKDIITSIMLKNYNVRENAPVCRNKEIIGTVNSPDFTICLDNIKNQLSPVKHYVNETVYHEAVHVAQGCKKGSLNIPNVNLSSDKLNDVVRSTNITKTATVYEVEAYYLEDKPEEVLSYLKKYCF